MNPKKPKIDKTYFILLVSVTLVTYLIYLLVFPRLEPLVKPIQVQDIVFLETTDDHSTMKFINADGSGEYTRDVSFSIPRIVRIFGLNIPVAYRDIENQISTVSWGPDGEMLAFTYPITKGRFRYPGIITTDGEILTCPQDESLFTYYLFPVQLIDQERIVINIGLPSGGKNYLAVYNMRKCKQESVYFNDNYEGAFSISSNGWLAIFQEKEHENYIVIYDEHQKPVDYFHTFDVVNWIQWSNDDNQLLYIDAGLISSKTLYHYDVLTGKKLILNRSINSASFSADGKYILYEKNGQIFIQDVKTRKAVFLADGINPQWRP